MADQITPPGRFVSSPLTPPPTDGKIASTIRSILNGFRSHYRGSRPTRWLVYSLKHEAYEDILQVLKSDADLDSRIKYKVRLIWTLWDGLTCSNCPSSYDYGPRCSLLTTRMPTPLHEIICAEMVRGMNHQLETISGCPEAEFAQKIIAFRFVASRIARGDKWRGEVYYTGTRCIVWIYQGAISGHHC